MIIFGTEFLTVQFLLAATCLINLGLIVAILLDKTIPHNPNRFLILLYTAITAISFYLMLDAAPSRENVANNAKAENAVAHSLKQRGYSVIDVDLNQMTVPLRSAHCKLQLELVEGSTKKNSTYNPAIELTNNDKQLVSPVQVEQMCPKE